MAIHQIVNHGFPLSLSSIRSTKWVMTSVFKMSRRIISVFSLVFS